MNQTLIEKLEKHLNKQNITFSYCDHLMTFGFCEEITVSAEQTTKGILIELFDNEEGVVIEKKDYKSFSSVTTLLKKAMK
jgi:hypothetical protein